MIQHKDVNFEEVVKQFGDFLRVMLEYDPEYTFIRDLIQN